MNDVNELEYQEQVLNDRLLDDEKQPQEELLYLSKSMHVVPHLFDWISLMKVNKSQEANVWEHCLLVVEVLVLEDKNLEESMVMLVEWLSTKLEEQQEKEIDEQIEVSHWMSNEQMFHSNGDDLLLYMMNKDWHSLLNLDVDEHWSLNFQVSKNCSPWC